jgi:hypothetical protein
LLRRLIHGRVVLSPDGIKTRSNAPSGPSGPLRPSSPCSDGSLRCVQRAPLPKGGSVESAVVARSSKICSWSGAPVGGIRVVESKRSIAGRQFEPVEEMKLRPALVGLGETLARTHDRLIGIPEFVGPFGVVDLLVLAADAVALRDRLAAEVVPITYEMDAAIVAALAAGVSRMPHVVAERAGMDVESVARRIPRLVRSGAVFRTARGGLLRHRALVSVGRFHALEAKVRDWRSGIAQARRYRLWADTATVVMSRLPATSEPVVDEAARWGLGLAVEDEWVRRPRLRHHSATRRLLVSELAIAAMTTSTSARPSASESPALALGI